MTDVYVAGRGSDKAVLFLAAAETLGLDPSVVRTTTNGYNIPEDVAAEAGFDADGNRLSDAPKVKSEPKQQEPKKAPAKKAAAKKAPAKKAPAKKAAAKKTAAKKAPSTPKGKE